MSYSQIVQVLAAIAVLAGFIASITIFYKALANRDKQRKVFLQFLLVEIILVIAAGFGLILVLGLPKSIIGFGVVSIFVGSLANLPVAIITKIFILIFHKKDKG